ncbi:MAG: 50S ribosomal protein L24 [Deltaproteobacteria bacterium]|nr:MAG: 50S ribosomal protein L24 [Deltaproteobacteria bacterium]
MQHSKCLLKKDDKVKVLTGKDRGKIGKILKVDRKKSRLLVENVNIVKKHSRPNAQNKQGGIIEAEASINMANVMLMCTKCVKPTRIRRQRLEDGKQVRVCAKCQEIIDT